MKKEMKDINNHAITDLFSPCNGCIYWEAPEKFGKDEHGKPKAREDEAIEIKRGWFKKIGICSVVAGRFSMLREKQ